MGVGRLPRVIREDESRSLASFDRWSASFTIAGEDDKDKNEGSTFGGRRWHSKKMGDCLDVEYGGATENDEWVRYPQVKFWNFYLGGVDHDLPLRWKLCQGAFRFLQGILWNLPALLVFHVRIVHYGHPWCMRAIRRGHVRILHVVLRASRWRGWGRDNYHILGGSSDVSGLVKGGSP